MASGDFPGNKIQDPDEGRTAYGVRQGAGAKERTWVQTTTSEAAALLLALGILAMVWIFIRPIAIAILGITLAAALSPLVSRLERRLPRALAVVLLYLAILIVFGVILALMFPTLSRQTRQAIDTLPGLIRLARDWLESQGWLPSGSLGGTILDRIFSQFGLIGPALLALPRNIFTFFIDLIFIVFISIYWLIAAPSMRRFFLSLFPPARAAEIDRIQHEIGSAMGGYFRGVLLNGIIMAVVSSIGFSIIGLRYPLFLGLVEGLFEFIPIVGPVISGTVAVGAGLIQSAGHALIVLIFVIVLQQSESHILIPNVMRSQTSLSPVLAIIALLAGATVGGILGALVAIPLAAALQVLVRETAAPAIRRAWSGKGEKTENSATTDERG